MKSEWLVGALVTVAVSSLVFAASAVEDERFEAESQILVTPVPAEPSEFVRNANYAYRQMSTYRHIAATRSVAIDVTEQLRDRDIYVDATESLAVDVAPRSTVLRVSAEADNAFDSVAIANAAAETVTDRLSVIESRNTYQAVAFSVVDTASDESVSSLNDTKRARILGVVLALMCGLLWVLCASRLNLGALSTRTIQSRLGLSRHVDVGVLSDRTRSKRLQGEGTVSLEPGTSIAKLSLEADASGVRRHLVSGFTHGVSTEMVTGLLGKSLSGTGRRVLVIDAAGIVGAPSNMSRGYPFGLSDDSIWADFPADSVVEGTDDSFDFLPSGERVRLNVGMPSREAYENLLRMAERNYDTVLVLGPSVDLLVSRAPFLLSSRTGLILVVEGGACVDRARSFVRSIRQMMRDVDPLLVTVRITRGSRASSGTLFLDSGAKRIRVSASSPRHRSKKR